MGDVLDGSQLPDHNDGQTILLPEFKHHYRCFWVFSLEMGTELVGSQDIMMGKIFFTSAVNKL